MIGKGSGRSSRSLLSGFGALVLLATVAGVVSDLSPAEGAFPESNGTILCASNRDGNFEIYAFNPDGSSPTRLTNHPATDLEATPSPDGNRIAFTSTREGNDQEIYVMNRDGSGLRRLTFSPGEDRPGTWSPDGTQIAFHSARFPAPPGLGHSSLEIMKMNADGSNQTRLTNNNFQDSFAHWSPRGDKIAFTTNRDSFVGPGGQPVSNFEIYTMNTDGSNPTRITNSPGEDAHAHWSPDGSQFTFHTRRDYPSPTGLQIEIYRMNADGSNPVRLTGPDNVFDAFPAWSPDGTKIVWSREFPEDVYTMNATDGSGRTNITNTPGVSDTRCDWGPPPTTCTPPRPGHPPPRMGQPTTPGHKGTPGNDTIMGTAGDDVIHGLGGNDTISGGGGNDVICGGDGNDATSGGGGSDVIDGEAGHDQLGGGNGRDILFGGGGYDQAHGDNGVDIIFGNDGTDVLYGDDGNDYVFGGADSDATFGGIGDDFLFGDAGRDWLDGEAGNDRCDGGPDADAAARNCESTQNVP